MLFGKTIDDPKVNIASMRTYLAHKRVRAWLKAAVDDMAQHQCKRQRFMNDMRWHVAKLENYLSDPVAFVTNPYHLEKCSLVMQNVLRLMPTGRWHALEKLIDRLDRVAQKTQVLRVSIALLPARFNLKEDKYPPSWEQIV